MIDCDNCYYKDFETIGCAVHKLIMQKNELIREIFKNMPLKIKSKVYEKTFKEDDDCSTYIPISFLERKEK